MSNQSRSGSEHKLFSTPLYVKSNNINNKQKQKISQDLLCSQDVTGFASSAIKKLNICISYRTIVLCLEIITIHKR